MTNNPTIDGVLVPRELLSAYIERAKGYDDATLRSGLLAILDADIPASVAPAVERQEPKPSQVPVLRAMAANYRNGHSWDFLDGEAVSKAADEITAQASTIARLEARVAELESGMGEPVAWMYKREGGEILGQLVRMESDELECIRLGKCHDDGTRYMWPREDYIDWKPLFTAPPAPVAVVLPERKSGFSTKTQEAYLRGWNACLDATAALNGERK